MGVSLSLDGARPARRRGRGGQHSRSPEEQACLDALAAFLRSDAPSATRCLGKVPRAELASRLLPAVRALARAADLVLASDPGAERVVDNGDVLSPVCLVGMCQAGPAHRACSSAGCQHSCHCAA